MFRVFFVDRDLELFCCFNPIRSNKFVKRHFGEQSQLKIDARAADYLGILEVYSLINPFELISLDQTLKWRAAAIAGRISTHTETRAQTKVADANQIKAKLHPLMTFFSRKSPSGMVPMPVR